MSIEYSLEETPMGTAGSVRLAATTARRHVPRHLRRRADGLRPGRDRRLPPREGSGGDDRAQGSAEPARVRDRRHGRGRAHRALPREALLGPGVLGHDQHRHLRARGRSCCKHVPDDRPYDFSKELFPHLLEMGLPLYGYVCDGYWQDIGNLDQYRQANIDALDERVSLDVPGHPAAREHLARRGRRDRRPRGGRRTGVHRQLLEHLARGDVGAYSVLGASVRLRESARVVRSSSTVDVRRARNAIVEGAVVGKSCDIRSHARVHDGVALGDGVIVGAQAVVMPDVRIFPHKEIESGATVHESVDLGGGGRDAPVRPRGRLRRSSTSISRPRSRFGSPPRSARPSSEAAASSRAATRRPPAG